MTKIKSFTLNDEIFYTEQNVTLFDMLEYFNYTSSLLVLEHNHLVCHKLNWKTTFIKNQDQIEIVSIVGGG